MEDLSGKQLGAYRVVGPLGKGGMAAVYKAYHAAMDRYVALKVLPRHLASEPEFVARFHQEARVVAKLQHPHILPVHDFGEAEGYTYLVMPFIQGGTLAAQLKAGSLLPLERIRVILAQLGDALDYAHERGVIHRDVKPSNVLLDERGHCLLTDFGLAKMLEGSDQLTASGAFVGTPAYMSPEQGLGKPADARSDLYALGVIFYELVTGNTPFQAETPMAVVIKHISAPLPPPSSLNPNLPEAVERVILKAMAKDPADRFARANELVQATQAAIAGSAFTSSLTPGSAVAGATAAAATAATPTPVPTPTPAAAPTAAAQPNTVVHFRVATSAQDSPPQLPPIPPVPPTPRPTDKPAPATPKFSFWRTLLVSGFWWGVGLVLAGLFQVVFAREALAGAILGATGGWEIAGRWRKINPQVSSRRRWLFAGVGVAGAVVAVLLFQEGLPGALLVFPALGLTFGLLMRPLEPHLKLGRLFLLALSWLLIWLVGIGLITLGAQQSREIVAAGLIIPSLLLLGGLSAAFTLWIGCPRPH